MVFCFSSLNELRHQYKLTENRPVVYSRQGLERKDMGEELQREVRKPEAGDMLIILLVVIISWVSKFIKVHFKYVQLLYVNYASIKLFLKILYLY